MCFSLRAHYRDEQVSKAVDDESKQHNAKTCTCKHIEGFGVVP